MPASTPGFIHLRVHSAYSLLEGALPVKLLAKLAAKDAQPALAVTDRNNLFGALEIAETLAGAGIQPITGATIALGVREAESGNGGKRPGNGNGNGSVPPTCGSIALIAKDEEGYRNLLKLTSAAFLDHSETGHPHVTWEELGRHNAGLIALTGGPGRAGRPSPARRQSQRRQCAARSAEGDVRQPALCRDPAPRHGRGAPRRAGAAQARL